MTTTEIQYSTIDILKNQLSQYSVLDRYPLWSRLTTAKQLRQQHQWNSGKKSDFKVDSDILNHFLKCEKRIIPYE